MENVIHNNTFSRVSGNEAKMGYFPTDKNHCERIQRMIDFSCEEIACIDLCAGEGGALISSTGKKEGDNLTLFAVELNNIRASQLRENPLIDYVVEGDSLTGTKISHKAFSFAFANPPYGTVEGNKRLESLFLERYSEVLCKDGLLVLIVPHYVLADESFVRKLLWRFQPFGVYRFDDTEYAKYKQCAVFAYKKADNLQGYKAEAVKAFLESVGSVTDLPYLPYLSDVITKKARVVPTKASNVNFFTTEKFNPMIAEGRLSDTLSKRVVSDLVGVSAYTGTKVGRPPVPLNRNLLHMCAVGGVGQGITGSEETGDLHLQKGRVQMKETVTYEKSGDKTVEHVVLSAVTTMVIIDNNGNIKELVGEAGGIEASEEDEE